VLERIFYILLFTEHKEDVSSKKKIYIVASSCNHCYCGRSKCVISIVKPTRCTKLSNLFYFGMTLYVFRTVFSSITRSSRLYIEQQAFVKQILLSACCMYSL